MLAVIGVRPEVVLDGYPVRLVFAGSAENDDDGRIPGQPIFKIGLIADEFEAVFAFAGPGLLGGFALDLNDQVCHPAAN